MPRLFLRIAPAIALAMAAAAHAQPQPPKDASPMPQTASSDAWQWLEGVTDDKALDWVRQRNARTEAELAGTPAFKQLEADIRAILDSDAKIPAVYKQG